MKIRTKLYLSSLISIGLIAVLIMVLIQTSSEVAEQNKQRAASRQALQAVSELDILTYEYLLHHEKRAEQQWHLRYDSLGQYVKALAVEEKETEEKEIVNRLSENYNVIGASFSELSASYKKMQKLTGEGVSQKEINVSTAAENRLAARFLIVSQSMIRDASILAEKNVSDLLNAQAAGRNLALFLGLILLINGVIAALVVVRIIAKSLHMLHAGADKVGQGDLDYKIEVKSKDEIGHIAETFNQMTANLKVVTASKTELEKEISERKRVEEELRRSEERWATTLASIGDAVMATDAAGKITFLNAVAESLTGWTLNEVIGKSIVEVFNVVHEQTRNKADNPAIAALEKGTIVALANYTLLIKKDGNEIPIDDSGASIKDRKGRVVGAVLVFRDITERKRLESRKDEFIGIASHELKTPITIIKAFTEILQKRFEKAKDTQNEYFARNINGQVDRLTNLVNDLLDVSKIQAGKMKLNFKMLDLDSLIKKTIDDFQYITKTHQIEKNGEVKRKFYGDEERVHQVLVNLLSNAIKYSPNADKVIINSFKDKDRVRVSVQDFGLGITEANRKKIFERFYRGEERVKKNIPGFGMGLYICREIVQRHGGELWCESKKGKGSTFYFTLPIKLGDRG